MNSVAVAADLETAQDILSSTYGAVRIDPRGPRRGLRLERSVLGPVQFHHVNIAMDFDAVGDPLQSLIFGQLISGRVRQASGGSDRRYVPGQSYIASVREADVQLAVIDPALPSQVADTEPDRAQVPVQFTGYEPVSVQAATRWTDTYAYLRDNFLTEPGITSAPLVAASAARL